MTINKQPTKKAAIKTNAVAKKVTGSSARKTAPAINATKSGDERMMVPLRLLTPSRDNVRRFTSEAGSRNFAPISPRWDCCKTSPGEDWRRASSRSRREPAACAR